MFTSRWNSLIYFQFFYKRTFWDYKVPYKYLLGGTPKLLRFFWYYLITNIFKFHCNFLLTCKSLDMCSKVSKHVFWTIFYLFIFLLSIVIWWLIKYDFFQMCSFVLVEINFINVLHSYSWKNTCFLFLYCNILHIYY